jgi:hypothetical protein
MSMAKRLFLLVTICGAALLVAGRSQSGRFSKDLYPILEKAGCEGCHNPNGVASATRLHFPTG